MPVKVGQKGAEERRGRGDRGARSLGTEYTEIQVSVLSVSP